MMRVKKYGNRRLYDTAESCYITLEDLAAHIQAGADVEVVDAKTGQDLTQATLAQIILESRGAARLLPVPLLKQLIRMGDDALGEFFGRYMTWALEVYLAARQGAQVMGPFSPFAALSLFAQSPLARLFTAGFPGSAPPSSIFPPPMSPPAPDAPMLDGGGGGLGAAQEEIASLRREIEKLKRAVRRTRAKDD
jgi:polyhydroxyalkanoate synthesis repressor PhaR